MNINALTAVLPTRTDSATSPASSATPSGGFARLIDQALEQISAPGRAAERAVNDLAMGETDNLHQVMLAVAQADLAFRLALEVRNKLIEAYQEIQRMQV